MAIQMIVGNDSIKNLAGEWVVFMSLALYLSIDCVRNGIWDRKLKPNLKTNIIASSIAAVLTGIIWFSVPIGITITYWLNCNWNYYVCAGGNLMFISINDIF